MKQYEEEFFDFHLLLQYQHLFQQDIEQLKDDHSHMQYEEEYIDFEFLLQYYQNEQSFM